MQTPRSFADRRPPTTPPVFTKFNHEKQFTWEPNKDQRTLLQKWANSRQRYNPINVRLMQTVEAAFANSIYHIYLRRDVHTVLSKIILFTIKDPYTATQDEHRVRLAIEYLQMVAQAERGQKKNYLDDLRDTDYTQFHDLIETHRADAYQHKYQSQISDREFT
eukprot:3789293-Rhodomonas_salina.1